MINIGILGTGFGKEHLRIFKSINDVNVIEVFGRNETKLKDIEKKFEISTNKNIENIIQNKNINIIDICLPTDLHVEYINKSIKNGKNVICETPLCHSKDELDKIKDTGNNRIYVSSFLKYFVEYEYLKKEIEEHKLGDIRILNMKRQMYGNLGIDKIILYLMIHEIDFIAWLFGEPEKIYVDEIVDKEKQSFVRSPLKYNDIEVSIQASSMMPANYPFTIGFEAFFDNGYLEFNCSFIGNSIEKKLIRYSENGIENITLENIYPYQTMLEDFVNCEEKGTKSRLDIDFAKKGLNIAFNINEIIKRKK